VVGSRPGRGSSVRALQPVRRNRDRQFVNMFRDMPSSAATSPIVPPAVHGDDPRPRTQRQALILGQIKGKPASDSAPPKATK